VAEGDRFTGPDGRPCVILATGMGGTMDSGLFSFAEAFAEAGLDALAFDYRGWGESSGSERQVAWQPDQREDLASAIRVAPSLDGVDPNRLVLWGWSWGASHCLYRAAAAPDGIVALIAVGPDADGLATVRHLISQEGLRSMMRLNGHAVRDLAAKARGLPPVHIPIVGPPGSDAVLSTPGCEARYKALGGPTWRNEVAARVAVSEGMNRGVSKTAEVKCPILVQGGEHDQISPPSVPRKVAWEAKGRSELREYPSDHFGFLLELRDRVIEDQLHFLGRHLAATEPAAATA
jgi:pimeloyl-ACP methyl ester carboxylesterase